jgi:hypothetical protein
MPKQAPSSIPQMEKGLYHGRVSKIVDLGIQDGKFGLKHKCWIEFTFPTEVFTNDEGKEFMRQKGKYFNVPAAYNENSDLILLHEALCEDGEPVTALLGKACSVQLKPNGDYMNVESVGAPMKGFEVAEIDDMLCVTDQDWEDTDLIDKLPNFIKNALAKRVKPEAE